MATSTPSALIAATPTLFRQGLVTMFRERWPQLLLTLTADATQVLGLALRRAFGLLVLEGELPGLLLPELLRQLHQTRPRQRLLVFTDQRVRPPRMPLPWPNTHLLISSRVTPEVLAIALSPWLDALPETGLTPAHLMPTLAWAPIRCFSPRELEVLHLVLDDYCNEEIATQLSLSVRTVESHRRMLLHKAGTRTLVGLAARAVREGWVA